jgi:Leucine-rich repeat (LRR) protein
LVHLKGLTYLSYLDLPPTVGDAGVEHLKALTNLTNLRLDGTQVTDAGLEGLKNLKRLKTLRLDGTKVTPEGVKRLKTSLPVCDIQR